MFESNSLAALVSPTTYQALYLLEAGSFFALLAACFYFIYASRRKDRKIHDIFEENKILKGGLMTRNNDLNDKIASLEQASRHKDNCFRSISHEHNNYYNGILNSIEAMREMAPKGEMSDKIEDLENLVDLAKNAASRLMDSVYFLRGNYVLKNSVFNLKDTCQRAMELVRTEAEFNDCDLYFYYQEGLSEYFIGDSYSLINAVRNIVHNSTKFTRGGYISIEVSGESHYVNDVLEIKITDTGIGIPDGELEKIFENAYQVKGRTDRLGSGLGLSITKKIINMMGGEIRVRSSTDEKSHGTAFVIDLVLERADSAAVQLYSEKELVNQSFNGARVLVVDDIDFNMDRIVRHLEDIDCRVSTAKTGTKALDKLLNHEYDIVFMDYDLPDLDAPDVVMQFQQQNFERFKSTPVVAVTGHRTPEIRNDIERSGIIDVIYKPFAKDSIVRAMNECLDVDNLKQTIPVCLIVDDDRMVRLRMASSVCSIMPLKCLHAASFKEAIKIINSHKIDYLITDYLFGMDQLTGIDLLREAKEHQSELTAMLMSGRPIDKFIREEAIKAGADFIKQKPSSMWASSSCLTDELTLFFARTLNPQLG